MEVEYELTPEDVQAWHDYHRIHAPAKGPRPFNLGGPLVAFLVIIVGPWFLTRYDSVGFMTGAFVGLAAGVLLAGIVVAFVYPITLTSRDQKVKRAAEEMGRMRLSLTPEGVRQSTDAGLHVANWPFICAIGTTRDHLFLYTNPQTGLVVPRRAFPGDAAFEQFVASARQFHEEAKSGGRGPKHAWQLPPSTDLQAPADRGVKVVDESFRPKEDR